MSCLETQYRERRKRSAELTTVAERLMPGGDTRAARRERRAHAIARKYALEISEPPDVSGLSGQPHHHFEFHRAENTIIEAHPKCLKIFLPDPPVIAEETLLEDLAALHKPTEQ